VVSERVFGLLIYLFFPNSVAGASPVGCI